MLIEDKLNKLNINGDSKKLLEESLICYKNSTYRAAFLMAYLSFKVAIKERLLNGKKPDEVNENHWSGIIKKLKKDDEWEDEINKIVMASDKNGNGDAAIFKFNDYERIKNRYQYWKDIRNSCVHAKTEEFTESLIRYFYDFLIEDLPHYHILGGKQYILNKIKEEYNDIQYYNDETVEKTLNECKLVYKSDFNQFINDFMDEINKDFTILVNNKIIIKILKDVDLRQACKEYIKDNISDIAKDLIWFEYDNKLVEEMYEECPIEFQKNIIPNILSFNGYCKKDFTVIIKIICVLLNNCPEQIDNSSDIFFNMPIINQVIKENDLMIVDLFRNHSLFNKFLNCAGNYYFNTGANDLYNQYLCSKNEEDVEPLFDYIEWDKDVIEKLNYAANFNTSISNENSKRNRSRRSNSIKKVYDKHKEEIERISSQHSIDIDYLKKL